MARRGSGTWLAQHYGPACRPRMVQVTIGSNVARGFDIRTKECWQAFAAVIAAFRYAVRSADTGVYNCRNTASGGKSPHSWATALDLNWLTNPATGGVYGGANRVITDMPAEMIAAIKNIKTKAGVKVFGWGGDYSSFKDAMHFEILGTPSELARGIDWSTVVQAIRDPKDPSTYPTLREGDVGPTVTDLQVRLINDARIHVEGGADGNFGPGTLAAVTQFQTSRGLTVDGVVGLQTWTALLAKMPALEPGDEGPVKDQPKQPDYAVAVRYGRGFPADERMARALAAAKHLHVGPHDHPARVGEVILVGGHAVAQFDRSLADSVREYAGATRMDTWQLISIEIAEFLRTT